MLSGRRPLSVIASATFNYNINANPIFQTAHPNPSFTPKGPDKPLLKSWKRPSPASWLAREDRFALSPIA